MCKRILMLIVINTVLNICVAVIEYKNWAFHFPSNSNMGLFIAVAVPIDLTEANVFVAYNFEANYLLPFNESETVQYPPLVTDEARHSKIIDRTKIYKTMEAKLDVHGYPGKKCLLRIICDATISNFEYNGVLGDIFQIILTPSSSVETNISTSYTNAENYGKNNKNCKKYHRKCPINFLDMLSA